MRFNAVAVVGLMVAAMAQAQQAKAPVVIGPAVHVMTGQQGNTVVTIGPRLPVGPAQQATVPDAQVRAEQQQKTVVILQDMVTALNESACPGALQAQQQATGGAMIWTTALGDKNAAPYRPQGLGIHVEFEGRDNAVKALELQVSYLPLGLHAMRVAPTVTNSAAAQPQEREKTFNLDREAALRIAGDLLVGPAATITRVHLVSVTFADGGVWRAQSDDACTVVPNRVMLVANR